MGNRVTFEVTATSRATPDEIYELLRSSSTWPTWSPIGSYTLEKPSPEGDDGVGALRLFKTSFVRTREEITRLEPGRGVSYRAFAGLPLRDHHASVELTAKPDGGTAIVWREDFRPKLPGTGGLLHRFLHRFVQQCADGLASHAEAKKAVG